MSFRMLIPIGIKQGGRTVESCGLLETIKCLWNRPPDCLMRPCVVRHLKNDRFGQPSGLLWVVKGSGTCVHT